ncbi:MAG: F0F1 ATP synthase subunit delta [Gammaproteobacteria bacterium]|jgi:F-type H+-transporting ATPase subunit delta|nr:F0F1 ATP synthase subunit delta [Gammaproteobacteria bacterium]
MLENATLARPYAKAIFAIAGDDQSGYSEQINLLAAIVADPQLTALIGHPRIPHAQLADVINDVAGEAFAKPLQDFVKILADNGRLPLLADIAEQFGELRAAAEKVLQVEVLTAMPLSETQHAALQKNLAQRFGSAIELGARVDESLLAGVIVRAGDQVIDASARGRLQRLGQAMQHG